MAHINGTILIHRPVEMVFDYVADQTNEPTYNPQMSASTKLTPGPIGRPFWSGLKDRLEAEVPLHPGESG